MLDEGYQSGGRMTITKRPASRRSEVLVMRREAGEAGVLG